MGYMNVATRGEGHRNAAGGEQWEAWSTAAAVPHIQSLPSRRVSSYRLSISVEFEFSQLE